MINKGVSSIISQDKGKVWMECRSECRRMKQAIRAEGKQYGLKEADWKEEK